MTNQQGCCHCGKSLTQPSGRGRRRTYCGEKCRSAYRRAASRPLTARCGVCGQSIQAAYGRRYCKPWHSPTGVTTIRNVYTGETRQELSGNDCAAMAKARQKTRRKEHAYVSAISDPSARGMDPYTAANQLGIEDYEVAEAGSPVRVMGDYGYRTVAPVSRREYERLVRYGEWENAGSDWEHERAY